MVILGLAAEGVTQVKSNGLSGQIIAALNLEAADAAKTAAEAQLELRKLKAPRALTAAQQDKIVGELRHLAPQKYAVGVGEGQETMDFMCSIDGALQKAGWTRVPAQFGDLSLATDCGSAGAFGGSGVRVEIPMASSQKHAELLDRMRALRDALTKAGTPGVLPKINLNPNPVADSVDLTVINVLVGAKTVAAPP